MLRLFKSGVNYLSWKKPSFLPEHHKEGRAIITSVEKGALGKPVITDYILNEVVTFVRKRKGAAASIEMLDA
ncbi:hypothetical protein J7L27_02870 [Candidatus Bathyarchaeota archaeon]|nr:hypothetical protein [Candidatus Bathyarchaeota archaeon]